MTAGERLIQQGEERGIRQGIQQGIQQGERKTLLRQLQQRFSGEVDADIETRVAAATAEQIDAWVVRVLTVSTLAELFAD